MGNGINLSVYMIKAKVAFLEA